MINEILMYIKKGKNKLFYQINNSTITYNELYERVIETSDLLRRQGNMPVVIYGNKEIDVIISIISCIVAKRCYIPIDYYTPNERIKKIINESKATLVIEAKKELFVDNVECFTLSELKDKYNDKKDYYKINNNYAYTIFTSGSTGNAKGVPISYVNLSNFIEWVISNDLFKDISDLKILSQASFSFDLSVMDIYFSIYKNLTIIGMDSDTKKDISLMYDTIKNNDIEFLVMTPTFCKMLLINYNFNEINLPNIKYMFFCGECLEVETARKIRKRFTDVIIINAYGPTEATCFVSLVEIKDDMFNMKYLPVGLVSESAVKISIVDNEIVLEGKSVFDGYLNLKTNSCYKNNNNNCFSTNDMGLIKDNYLYCIGRMDNQIKYMGYRIELNDIGNNILKINGVREAVVIADYVIDTNIVKSIKAYITVEKDIDSDYIKKELTKLVPIYMVPKVIRIIDKIPVNGNNKYDRRRLEEL